MRTLSSTCLSIALAHKAGELRLVTREGRFGAFVSIEDAFGVIEVAADMAEAEARVAAVTERVAA
jgi:hypothetical protein